MSRQYLEWQQINLLKVPTPKSKPRPRAAPTSIEKQLEAELWSAHFGFPSSWQLKVITSHADGLPLKFAPHPFSKSESKMAATVIKQPSGKTPLKVTKRGQQFYADYGFMRSSTTNYARPNKEHASCRG